MHSIFILPLIQADFQSQHPSYLEIFFSPGLLLQQSDPAHVSEHLSETGAQRVFAWAICVCLILYSQQIGYCVFLEASDIPFLFQLVSQLVGGLPQVQNSLFQLFLPGAQILTCFYSLSLLSLSLFSYLVTWRYFFSFHYQKDFKISEHLYMCSLHVLGGLFHL